MGSITLNWNTGYEPELVSEHLPLRYMIICILVEQKKLNDHKSLNVGLLPFFVIYSRFKKFKI